MIPGLFVTGTDTGVGKTRVAALIAAALTAEGRRTAVLKPVATGATPSPDGWRSEDAEALMAAVGGGVPAARVAPIAFEAPLAPPVAARVAGGRLEHSAIREAAREALDWWVSARGAEVAVVEGVGGLLCPLAEGTTVADLALDLDYPLVIVARRSLGTLNHALLTVEAALRRGLRIAGLVLNTPEPVAEGPAERTNPAELARRLGDVPILAELPHTHDGAALPRPIQVVDWWGRARTRRLVDGSPPGARP